MLSPSPVTARLCQATMSTSVQLKGSENKLVTQVPVPSPLLRVAPGWPEATACSACQLTAAKDFGKETAASQSESDSAGLNQEHGQIQGRNSLSLLANSHQRFSNRR